MDIPRPHYLLIRVLISLIILQHSSSLLPIYPPPLTFLRHFSACHRRLLDGFRIKSQILNAEIEPVQDNVRSEPSSQKGQTRNQRPKSLVDLSLQADPEIGSLRIPFVDGENLIDVKLAFMTELDGVSYAIGIPFDHAAAITLEKKDGSIENISPDFAENEELMEIMAVQLQQHVGKDLQLIRSPRILTISGPLEKYTDKWQEELLPKSVDTETLLDDDDEDEESFLKFMKEQLGEEEFTKTMNEEHTFDDDVLDLFSVPGMGDREDDLEEFLQKEMMDIVSSFNKNNNTANRHANGKNDNGDTDEDDEDEKNAYLNLQQRIMEDVVGKADLVHDGVALKLVTYYLPNGNRYSLVKLLKPFVLIAKESKPFYPAAAAAAGQKGRGAPRFELLTLEELRLVAPRLEEVCQADLEQAGIRLDDY